MIGQWEGKRPRLSNSRPVRSTLLNTPIDHILTLIKDDPMLEWPKRMNEDPSKWSKHQILTLPPRTWTWHKIVLWSETTNRDPCRPREVGVNWSNPARWKTNTSRKRRLLDDNHPTRETQWVEATTPLEYRMPEEYLLYLRLKKKQTTNTAYPSTISPR